MKKESRAAAYFRSFNAQGGIFTAAVVGTLAFLVATACDFMGLSNIKSAFLGDGTVFLKDRIVLMVMLAASAAAVLWFVASIWIRKSNSSDVLAFAWLIAGLEFVADIILFGHSLLKIIVTAAVVVVSAAVIIFRMFYIKIDAAQFAPVRANVGFGTYLARYFKKYSVGTLVACIGVLAAMYAFIKGLGSIGLKVMMGMKDGDAYVKALVPAALAIICAAFIVGAAFRVKSKRIGIFDVAMAAFDAAALGAAAYAVYSVVQGEKVEILYVMIPMLVLAVVISCITVKFTYVEKAVETQTVSEEVSGAEGEDNNIVYDTSTSEQSEQVVEDVEKRSEECDASTSEQSEQPVEENAEAPSEEDGEEQSETSDEEAPTEESDGIRHVAFKPERGVVQDFGEAEPPAQEEEPRQEPLSEGQPQSTETQEVGEEDDSQQVDAVAEEVAECTVDTAEEQPADSVQIAELLSAVKVVEENLEAAKAEESEKDGKINARLDDIETKLDAILILLGSLQSGIASPQPVLSPMEEQVEEQTPQESEAAPEKEEEIAPVYREEYEIVEAPYEQDDTWLEAVNAERVKPKLTFEMKLRTADDKVKEFYNELKNDFMSYGMHSRISKFRENFSKGRNQVARLCINGKTLKVYLAIDPSSLDEEYYHHKDVSYLKGAKDVPTMINIKSRLAVRKVKELVEIITEDLVIKRKKRFESVDYLPLLVNEGLSSAQCKGYGYLLRDELALDDVRRLPDNFAEQLIDVVESDQPKTAAHKVELSLDDISAAFQDGAQVYLDALKGAGLVPSQTDYIIVGDGKRLDKKLTVFADEFSPDAIKLLCLCGGEAYLIVEPGDESHNYVGDEEEED